MADTYTLAQANRMFNEWYHSDTDQSFSKYWGLSKTEMAQIQKLWDEESAPKRNAK